MLRMIWGCNKFEKEEKDRTDLYHIGAYGLVIYHTDSNLVGGFHEF